LKIGIAKPDFGSVGGYERVIERIAAELHHDGHAITWIKVDALDVPELPFGVPLPRQVAPELWEFQRYSALTEIFAGLDTSDFDLVVSTQPPSFAIRHERHLSVFSHHHRIYYDLEDVHVQAGFADPVLHPKIASAIRELDQPSLDAVSYFLAASEEVAARLERFNGLSDNVGVYHAGVAFRGDEPGGQGSRHPSDWYAISVARHEFPKRGELFIQAMKHLPAQRGVLVGDGSRLAWLRALDARLSTAPDPDAVTAMDLWLNTGPVDRIEYATLGTNVDFIVDATSDELHDLYANAGCVVAPAYLEDYGLTAVEAMTYGLPLIVCTDGGGLKWFVEDGVNGLVVEPTGRAIADAMTRLRDDPELAAAMGRESRERAAQFTWANALNEIRQGVAQVADGPEQEPSRN
jgi:glycosyltransferase involved in cell wall biosynthesis